MAMHQAGAVLAFAPQDSDGLWIHRAVAEAKCLHQFHESAQCVGGHENLLKAINLGNPRYGDDSLATRGENSPSTKKRIVY
jgi:hypothetical protein